MFIVPQKRPPAISWEEISPGGWILLGSKRWIYHFFHQKRVTQGDQGDCSWNLSQDTNRNCCPQRIKSHQNWKIPTEYGFWLQYVLPCLWLYCKKNDCQVEEEAKTYIPIASKCHSWRSDSHQLYILMGNYRSCVQYMFVFWRRQSHTGGLPGITQCTPWYCLDPTLVQKVWDWNYVWGSVGIAKTVRKVKHIALKHHHPLTW